MGHHTKLAKDVLYIGAWAWDRTSRVFSILLATEVHKIFLNLNLTYLPICVCGLGFLPTEDGYF